MSSQVIDKIQRLNEQAWELCFRDTTAALEICEQARQLADMESFSSGLAYSLRNQGVCHWILGDSETAFKELQQALELFQKLEDRQGESNALNWIGNSHWRLNQFQEALTFHIQALNLRSELGDQKGQAASLNNIGLIYHDLGHYDVALDYYIKSLHLFELVGDSGGVAKAVNNLALIYEKLGDDEKALELNLKSLKLKREVGNRMDEAGSLTNIGNAYRRLKEYDHAVEYHTRAIAIAREINNRLGEGQSLLNLGNVYQDMNQPEKALECTQTSLQIFQEIGDKFNEVESQIKLAEIMIKEERFEDALVHLQAGLQRAEELGSDELLFEIHRALSEFYEITNDPAKAFSHLKSCFNYRETMFSAEAERKIKNLVVKSEVEKAQQEAEIYRLRNVELAQTFKAIQRADTEKAKLFEQLRLKSEALEQLTFQDSLTGLYNRRYLDSRLEQEFLRSRRLRRNLTLVMVDIDSFKTINDRFMHDIGDQTLKAVALLLQKTVRSIDVVGRYGGDEFLVMLLETGADEALEVCERMQQAVSHHAWQQIHPDLAKVSISLGFSGDMTIDTAKELVDMADKNLYRAKQQGKDQVIGADDQAERKKNRRKRSAHP
jgi:diguanylate cyclase (GGDEF)-like protein